ncbi:hypothetical protein [Pseudoneobacillus sp. C159]
MIILNRMALCFVVFFSVCMIFNTYLGEKQQVQSNFVYFLLNGFAYIVSAMEVEREKHLLIEKPQSY